MILAGKQEKNILHRGKAQLNKIFITIGRNIEKKAIKKVKLDLSKLIKLPLKKTCHENRI